MVLERVQIPSDTREYILNNFSSQKVSKRKDATLQTSDYFTDKSIKIVNEVYSNWFQPGNYQKASKAGELRPI